MYLDPTWMSSACGSTLPPREAIVLIVPEGGVRGALVARLSMAGEAVLTACGLHDPVVQRLAQRGATLVVDHCLVGEGSEMVASPGQCWPNRVVVLEDGATLHVASPWLAVAPPSAACIFEALHALRQA